MGANNGALHTTWRNSGAGVSGAAVDIGDPESEGERVAAEKSPPSQLRTEAQIGNRQDSRSSAGIGKEIGSAGSAERAGGT